MKIKLLSFTVLMAALVLFSCQGNPQKKAEREANKEAQAAENQENMAESNLDKGVEHAAKAAGHRTMEELNTALKSVAVPTFDNSAATELAKKIGNHGVDFVNSDSNQEMGKYADMINADLAELATKVQNGKITADEASKITSYANNLAQAVGLDLGAPVAAPAN